MNEMRTLLRLISSYVMHIFLSNNIIVYSYIKDYTHSILYTQTGTLRITFITSCNLMSVG